MLSVLLTGLAGILITAYNQAEIFIPHTKETFSLPAIPGNPRVWHSLTGTILCGGAHPNTKTTCLNLKSNGDGRQPHSSALVHSRMAHSAWDSPSGVVLLGGYYSAQSTELVTSTNSTSQFTMNDTVRLGSEENNLIKISIASLLVMPVPSMTGLRSLSPEGSATGTTCCDIPRPGLWASFHSSMRAGSITPVQDLRIPTAEM